MENLKVIVDPDTLELTRSGAVAGAVWLSINGDSFPESGWYDFPGKVLLSWLNGYERVAGSVGEVAKLHFMEGSFDFILSAIDDGLTVKLFEQGRECSSAVVIDGPIFRDSILDACRLIIRKSREHGWQGSEFGEIARVLARA